MDRDIIASCPGTRPGIAAGDAGPVWHVSKLLDARRSNGEKELVALSGQSVLLPKDPAFHPDEVGLKWRSERLIA
jgi:hypothetical protein